MENSEKMHNRQPKDNGSEKIITTAKDWHTVVGAHSADSYCLEAAERKSIQVEF